MERSLHPVANVTWLDASQLDANEYNPNVVITPEMRLLKHSILTTGWIQPILVARPEGKTTRRTRPRYKIIDGFHRAELAKHDDEVSALTSGQVPCCVLELSEADRMMLTVRINRAKGSHVAVKMHDLVSRLVNDLEVPIEDVCKGIGATRHEVNVLLQDNVFKRLDTEKHEYSRAWTPKTGRKK